MTNCSSTIGGCHREERGNWTMESNTWSPAPRSISHCSTTSDGVFFLLLPCCHGFCGMLLLCVVRCFVESCCCFCSCVYVVAVVHIVLLLCALCCCCMLCSNFMSPPVVVGYTCCCIRVVPPLSHPPGTLVAFLEVIMTLTASSNASAS